LQWRNYWKGQNLHGFSRRTFLKKHTETDERQEVAQVELYFVQNKDEETAQTQEPLYENLSRKLNFG